MTSGGTIRQNMKFLKSLLGTLSQRKKQAGKTLEQYKQDVLIRQGKVQFEKLMQKGLSIPVAIL